MPALNVNPVESSAISEGITMLAATQNVGGGVIPFESTAVSESLGFAIPETFNYTQYLALKSQHVAAGLTYKAAQAQLATDQATYFTAVSTYASNETVANNAAVVSALTTVNADTASVNSNQQTWINLGTALEVVLGVMGQGV